MKLIVEIDIAAMAKQLAWTPGTLVEALKTRRSGDVRTLVAHARGHPDPYRMQAALDVLAFKNGTFKEG